MHCGAAAAVTSFGFCARAVPVSRVNTCFWSAPAVQFSRFSLGSIVNPHPRSLSTAAPLQTVPG